MKNIKIILLVVFVLGFASFLPTVFADTAASNLIPCTNECGYKDFLQLINNVINFLITIAVPISVGVIAWAGFLYMTTAVSDKKSQAKEMLVNVVKGFVVMLAAWAIVTTILNIILKDDYKSSIPVQTSSQ